MAHVETLDKIFWMKTIPLTSSFVAVSGTPPSRMSLLGFTYLGQVR